MREFKISYIVQFIKDWGAGRKEGHGRPDSHFKVNVNINRIFIPEQAATERNISKQGLSSSTEYYPKKKT